MRLNAHIEVWPLKEPFRIANMAWSEKDSAVVEVSDGRYTGRGEAQGIFYRDETARSMLTQIEQAGDSIEQDISRDELLHVMPSGGARNAVDCALWDLECKQSGKSIWELTGIEPSRVTSVFTISIEESAAAMAECARGAAKFPILKIKLDQNEPYQRLAAIRAARPDAELVVDANQSWTPDLLESLLPQLVPLGLSMIEQPLPRGHDEALELINSPIRIAADESCLDTTELDQAARRYSMINIKLDKTGGLTEALRLAEQARKRGLQLMVGNMTGTSLSMAPSFVIAQLCDLVDIDGPLFLRHDRPFGLQYDNGCVAHIDRRLWG